MLWNVKNEGLFNPSSTGNPDVQDRLVSFHRRTHETDCVQFFKMIWNYKWNLQECQEISVTIAMEMTALSVESVVI